VGHGHAAQRNVESPRSGDDSFFARRATRFLVRLDFDAKVFEKGSIFVGKLSHALPPLSCVQEGHSSAMRFSQASGEVIEGKRPRSCLNFKARFVSSRASYLRLVRLAENCRRHLFQAVLAHCLREMA